MTLFIGQNVSTFGGNLENYGTPIKINTLKYKHNNGFIEKACLTNDFNKFQTFCSKTESFPHLFQGFSLLKLLKFFESIRGCLRYLQILKVLKNCLTFNVDFLLNTWICFEQDITFEHYEVLKGTGSCLCCLSSAQCCLQGGQTNGFLLSFSSKILLYF